MRIGLIGGLVALVLAVAAQAQDSGWGDLDSLILNSLPQDGEVQAAYWLPDHTDPSVARTALAIVYAHIPGSAGNFGIDVGVFLRDSDGWAFRYHVDGVFGTDPRDVLFLGDRIELTTTTLRPEDARCCPSGEMRFSILRTTGTVTQLP